MALGAQKGTLMAGRPNQIILFLPPPEIRLPEWRPQAGALLVIGEQAAVKFQLSVTAARLVAYGTADVYFHNSRRA